MSNLVPLQAGGAAAKQLACVLPAYASYFPLVDFLMTIIQSGAVVEITVANYYLFDLDVQSEKWI